MSAGGGSRSHAALAQCGRAHSGKAVTRQLPQGDSGPSSARSRLPWTLLQQRRTLFWRLSQKRVRQGLPQLADMTRPAAAFQLFWVDEAKVGAVRALLQRLSTFIGNWGNILMSQAVKQTGFQR